MTDSPIYLDYAATTPVDPRVAATMLHYLTKDGIYGNASSSHAIGKRAREAVEHARYQVAELIHADASEIIWTSGATEANNLALKGASKLYQQKGKHLVTIKTEHPSVLDCCQQLEKEGFEVTYLSPQKNGLLDLTALNAALRKETILVSIMHVNNETGIIQDLAEIGKITSKQGILFHVDAAQSAGKILIDVKQMHIDLMSLSAHKVYGPKGIGALYIRKKPRVRVAAQIQGGGQESGMRSGTLPTHQIVGMGEAFSLAQKEMSIDDRKVRSLRELFLKKFSLSNTISVNTDPENSVPGILNVCFPKIKAQSLMSLLPELAISAGSACHAKGIEPSYVLRAMGLSRDIAECSVRISLGRFTTQEEVESALLLLMSLAGNF